MKLLLFLALPLLAQPVVIGINPLTADTGVSVVVKGSGFNATVGNNIVRINGTPAEVIAASAASLTFRTPAAAVYGPVSVTDLATGGTGVSPLFFVTTFPCGGNISQLSFNAADIYAFGFNSRGISSGDLDGDGRPDLVCSGAYAANGVVAYRNLGLAGSIAAGSLGAKVVFMASNSAWYHALADFDGDGKLDIAAAGNADTSVFVLRNTSVPGALSCEPPVKLTAGLLPEYVATADFNGDGKTDLCVSNYSSNTVSFFRNAGTPGSLAFAAKIDILTATNPAGLAVADIDNDGMPDLAVANRGSNTIHLLRNITSGPTIRFAAPVVVAAYNEPNGVAWGDMDGDGRPDLLVANESSTFLSFYRNLSTSGSVSLSARADTTVAYNPHNIALADINGDGRPDVAVTAGNPGTIVSLLENQSIPGAIRLKYTGSAPGGQLASLGLGWGDINGDGRPDLLASQSGNGVAVYENIAGGLAVVWNYSQTVCPGTGALFYIRVIGDSLAQRQWQEDRGSGFGNISNGGIYSGANRDSLRISSASAGMNGYKYRCVVTRSGCSVQEMSPVSTLTVNPATAVATHPADLTFCEANSGSFQITATGTSLTYQWDWDTSGTGTGSFIPTPNGGAISGAQSATITLTPRNSVRNMNGYRFRCAVTGTCGSAFSNPATLTLIRQARFTSQPAGVSVNEGAPAAFAVSVTGPDLTYQWQAGGGTSFTNIGDTGVYSGTRTASLAVSAAAYTLDGVQFRCAATGSCGPTAYSDPAVLVVNFRPRILQEPPARAAFCAGDTVRFPVTAAGTGITYQWQRRLAVWTNLFTTAFYAGSATNLLKLNGVPDSLAGAQFRVVIRGSINPPETSQTSILVSNTAPRILSPDSALALAGQPFAYAIAYADSETDTVTFVFRNLPSWLRDSANTVSGTPPPDAEDTSLTAVVLDRCHETALSVRIIISGSVSARCSPSQGPAVFAVSPNPFTRAIYIQVPDAAGQCRALLYDVRGRLAAEANPRPGPQFVLNAAGLGQGVYCLVVRNGGKAYKRKLLRLE